jgi:hypothetical protein
MREAYAEVRDWPAGISQKLTDVDVIAPLPLPSLVTDSWAVTEVPPVMDGGLTVKFLMMRFV